MSDTSSYLLNEKNLTLIHQRNQSQVSIPHYDRSQLQIGIVHLGFGGFHRAHLARYTHALMAQDFDANARWAILGVGLLPSDERMYDALTPQQGLYTLVQREGAVEEVDIIGSVHSLHFAAAPDPPSSPHRGVLALLDRISSPAVKIVSLTVTENGYCLHPVSKTLDLARVAHDLAHPRAPQTAIGVIVEAYRRRWAAGWPPFTALSCDNIQHNGHILKAAVLELAAHVDPALAAWISTHGRFPNSMVDRITPVTSPQDRQHVQQRYGIEDNWPVCCERFTQFVVEDDFADGRPAWESVGVQFVPDVAPYEMMKLRLLNASHLAVATLGDLAGFTYIDETMAVPLMSRYMRALMDRETGATLRPVPGVDLPAYKETLLRRFANEAIKDTVQRVATDAPLNTILDSIQDLLKMERPFPLAALCLAAWLRRVRGDQDDVGRQIVVRHPLAEQLRTLALSSGDDPMPLLNVTSLFGNLKDEPRVVTLVTQYLTLLNQHGSLKTLEQLSHELSF